MVCLIQDWSGKVFWIGFPGLCRAEGMPPVEYTLPLASLSSVGTGERVAWNPDRAHIPVPVNIERTVPNRACDKLVLIW